MADTAGFARVLEDAGAAAITVHGRTTGQLYRGSADWQCVGDVKRAVSVPVIGNGDLSSAEVCVERLGRYGVDGLAVARVAQGNPWIFEQYESLKAGNAPFVPGSVDRIEALREHAELFAHETGDAEWISPMRKHAIWYLSGVPYSSKLRGSVDSCTSLSDFESFCDRALELVEKARRDNEAHEALQREEP